MIMTENSKRHINPWAWVRSLYFAEGLPYVAVMTIAVILYKKMGISNTDIALYTGWLYLPWVIKPFWSPMVDLVRTKRWWIVTMQAVLAIAFAGIAFFIPAQFFFRLTLAFFWLVAFTSATHDIAADGVIDAKEKPRMEQYLEVLDEITNKAQTLKLIYRKQFGKQEV